LLEQKGKGKKKELSDLKPIQKGQRTNQLPRSLSKEKKQLPDQHSRAR
jgi:hypothetical protein